VGGGQQREQAWGRFGADGGEFGCIESEEERLRGRKKKRKQEERETCTRSCEVNLAREGREGES